MTNRQMVDSENRQRLTSAAVRHRLASASERHRLAPTIVATVVLDDEGQRWTRLPDAWSATAPLCASVDAYDFAGDTYIVACRRRSSWCRGETGFCASHFALLVEYGA
jgi:hypothetical protein